MNAPVRIPSPADAELDVIAKAIARALARQHHAETLAELGEGKKDEQKLQSRGSGA